MWQQRATAISDFELKLKWRRNIALGHRRNVIITINFADNADRFGIFPPHKPRLIRATGANYTNAIVLDIFLMSFQLITSVERKSVLPRERSEWRARGLRPAIESWQTATNHEKLHMQFPRDASLLQRHSPQLPKKYFIHQKEAWVSEVSAHQQQEESTSPYRPQLLFSSKRSWKKRMKSASLAVQAKNKTWKTLTRKIGNHTIITVHCDCGHDSSKAQRFAPHKTSALSITEKLEFVKWAAMWKKGSEEVFVEFNCGSESLMRLSPWNDQQAKALGTIKREDWGDR